MNLDLNLPHVLRAVCRQFDLLGDDGQIRSDVGQITVRLPGLAEPVVLFKKQPSDKVYKPGAGPTQM